MSLKERALAYHKDPVPGKLAVRPTKPCDTAEELSLAYTPGVAEPVREIARLPEEVYDYTAKGNLVAVVSNGTAILGLGNLGALASKPVMEGKAVLFKRFADIDVFDIEVDTTDPDEFIRTVKLISPTFGGINLEDIKAPECFHIEQRLIEECDIPVFHDDQHGTAIIATAGLINACELAGKRLEDVRVVFNGAGAAGIACARMFIAAGVKKEHIVMCDRKGVIHRGRDDLSPEKTAFAVDTPLRTLSEALKGADVFVGLSVGGVLSQEMVRSMAKSPIIFAMANPDPEIPYPEAKAVRPDLIMATGRSDFPNQINNVLGFPFIFRGALDVRASRITEGMKMAAARALAELAREPVPEEVSRAYGGVRFAFGPEYIVPKPFDPRVIAYESVAVARAACEEGVARRPITDWDGYRDSLLRRVARYWGT
ncbi:malic protein NAD-binding protein [Spirochaeta thermophila DSM 6578]|uniref:Malic protein NAD-binding protein n=1 Tax=Winmispira thermophila (strain ATCC 700085 / DSM 6578 / Z-1203) TaxID=869211 RepID=G0GA81_WINT7|nr:malic enzyme-like NAD(P)-binding protein [Spirochaeta thermophila]AEJ60917.1 malic protein NAD-binding protein [Spirochaeta thermophila DSM 6578]